MCDAMARSVWRGLAQRRKQHAKMVGGRRRERCGGLVASGADIERDASSYFKCFRCFQTCCKLMFQMF
jgi:hypothetical protein